MTLERLLYWDPRLISSNPTVQGPGFAFVALVIRAYLDDPIGVSGTCSKAHNDVPMSIGLSGIRFEWHGLLCRYWVAYIVMLQAF